LTGYWYLLEQKLQNPVSTFIQNMAITGSVTTLNAELYYYVTMQCTAPGLYEKRGRCFVTPSSVLMHSLHSP